MRNTIRPFRTRRHLLRTVWVVGCGMVLAGVPASLRQEEGAWPFAPAMAMADDIRDDREDRQDDRDDDRDDRDDDRDEDNSGGDDDNSGPGSGDDNDDDNSGPGGGDDNGGNDDDNSGPGNGGDDGGTDDNGGGDSSGPGNGGNDDSSDDDGNGGARQDNDDDDSGSPSTSRRIRNITVQYQDGWIERIVDGQYELIDNLNRRVILRPATIEDFNRMMALG